MVFLLIIFRTSTRKVIDAAPNFVTSIPISIISPSLAEDLKSISVINFVTTCEFSN